MVVQLSQANEGSVGDTVSHYWKGEISTELTRGTPQSTTTTTCLDTE
jgi:hypothetical protein